MCGGAPKWKGKGRGVAQVEGTATNRKGGHCPLCLPGMHAKGEGGGWGEVRHVITQGRGVA